MSANPQTQAIGIINRLLSLAVQLKGISDEMIALDGVWTDNNIGAVINAMGTVGLNTDGSLGSADATPNNAHPLSPTLYPAIQRSLSANQVTSIKTILDTIPTLIGGSSVPAQTGARGILNAAVGS